MTDQLNAPKDPRIGKEILKEKDEVGEYTDFKMSVKLQYLSTVCFGIRKREIIQGDKVEVLIQTHMYSQLLLNSVSQPFNVKRKVLSTNDVEPIG